MSDTQRFEGTKSYIATEDLKVAVNAAVMLRRPLLVKGEPGTGKTVLAHEISKALNAPLIEWNIKSTTKAQQGLYEYDAEGQLSNHQIIDWDDESQSWENVRTFAVSNVDGGVGTLEVREDWSDELNNWVKSMQYTNLYDIYG